MDLHQSIAEEYAHRIWELKDLSAIDSLLDSGIVIHSSLGTFHGREEMRRVVHAWMSAFPDLKVVNISALIQGDRTAIQWKAQGTHQGTFKGIPPTGKKVAYEGLTLYRIQEGKIVEYWAYLDMQHLIQQLQPEDPLDTLIALERDARAFGFDWPHPESIVEQAISECEEISEALLLKTSQDHLQEEIGDLIHTGISLCLFSGFDVEATLGKTAKKFGARMHALKMIAKERGFQDLNGQSFEFMLELWKEAKRRL